MRLPAPTLARTILKMVSAVVPTLFGAYATYIDDFQPITCWDQANSKCGTPGRSRVLDPFAVTT